MHTEIVLNGEAAILIVNGFKGVALEMNLKLITD